MKGNAKEVERREYGEVLGGGAVGDAHAEGAHALNHRLVVHDLRLN